MSWTPAEITHVHKQWTAGMTAVAIADDLYATFGKERSRDAVIGQVRCLGLVRVPRAGVKRISVARAPTVWDADGALDEAKSLWIAGMPIRPMAKALSRFTGIEVSANSVVGKMHRIGFAKKHPRSVNSEDAKEVRRVRGLIIAREKAAQRERKLAEQAAAMVVVMADVSNAKPWQERTFGECAYPLGERGEILSCCAPTEEAYCRDHRRLMGGYRKAWVATDHLRMARAA